MYLTKTVLKERWSPQATVNDVFSVKNRKKWLQQLKSFHTRVFSKHTVFLNLIIVYVHKQPVQWTSIQLACVAAIFQWKE